MARVAVIGEPLRIRGYGLVGALLCAASDRQEAITAFRALPDDVIVAILSPTAERWLTGEIARRPGLIPVRLPGPAGQEAQPFLALSDTGPLRKAQT